MAQQRDLLKYGSRLAGRRIRLLFIKLLLHHQPPHSPLEVDLVEEPLDTAVFDALSYRVDNEPRDWTRGLAVSDTRDYYFALAGIVKGLPLGIVDYSRTWREAACQVGLMTLMETGPPESRLTYDARLKVDDNITSEDSFDEFWRILVCNRDDKLELEQSAPESMGMSFGYYHLNLKLTLGKGWERDADLFKLHWAVLSCLDDQFQTSFNKTHGQLFLISEGNRMGWAPTTASPGDSIGIFQGSRIPFAARDAGGGGGWLYGGGCYIHGCMDGELWDAEEALWKLEMFV
ncbi:hypothetical protein FZEAL_3486 [Fusarium zealandicum]|uniref:Uncharacterized protein n=1 Tax=Fusarium zealandicum TaxID=1053134 RepID=A0A8H4UNT8_9HYPO|nr:hypothetical protein FZEAL_3486 [Fusarium zealandicum]